MHRTLRSGLFAALILAGGCGEDTTGPGSGDGIPDGELVATIVRTVRPDEVFYTIPLPPDPAVEGEIGRWEDAYRDVDDYALAGSGSYRGLTSGATIPLLVQVESVSAGASVRAVVDQPRGTLGVFGLLDHDVRVEIRVYQLPT